MKVFDAKPTIVLALANIVPRPEGYRRGGVVLLNTGPPKSSNDGIDSFHKSLGEKNNRHVVDRNGRKNRLDVGKSPSVLSLFALTIVNLALNLLMINS
jgi:hypothetical protein